MVASACKVLTFRTATGMVLRPSAKQLFVQGAIQSSAWTCRKCLAPPMPLTF